MFEAKLIALYFYICERYEAELKYECQRFSNNHNPVFSDQEVLTIYLYAVSEEKRFQIKDIPGFARRYLHSWFPLLPSYQAFNHRLNRLRVALQRLCAELLQQHRPPQADLTTSIVDSLPIITCSGKRKAKVACELTAKGYCATKGLYYHGLKLHALNGRRKATLPWLESLVVSSAAENDLSVFKQTWSEQPNRTFYGDKIYHNKAFFEQLYKDYNSEMFTPVKAIKGMPATIKQWHKAGDDLYCKAVSATRQPIESFFNWLNEKNHYSNSLKG